MSLASMRKFLVAVLAAAAVAAQAAITDGTITNQEWVTIALAGIGAALVYRVPNRQPDQRVADEVFGPRISPPTG